MRQARIILPAIFLTVVGLGNIVVGTLRAWDHEEIIEDLNRTNPLPAAAEGSAMLRLQLTKLSEEGLRMRQTTAEQRLHYYRLVATGGYGLVALGLGCFGFALRNNRRTFQIPTTLRTLSGH